MPILTVFLGSAVGNADAKSSIQAANSALPRVRLTSFLLRRLDSIADKTFM